MELKGRWKMAKIGGRDENMNPIWMNEEEYKASPEYDPDYSKDLFSSYYDFNEDGTISMLMKLPADMPQEEIDEAVKSGEISIRDGMAVINDRKPMRWKEEGGKYYIANNNAADPENPWSEIPIEDGLLQLLLFKLEKVN